MKLIPESETNPLSLYHQLARAISELRADIIHTHRYKENLYGCLLVSRLKVRHVSTLHGFEPPVTLLGRSKEAIRDFVSFRLAYRAGTRFAAVSRDLQRQYRVPDRHCVVIPNGIAIPPLRSAHSTAGTAAPVIGWVGRMVPIKSVATLFEAVALLADLQPKPTVLLLGDGPERSSLTELAARLGIQDQVVFQGFVNDLAPHYARMTAFALPSLHEGVPLALLEAMGYGVPVIAASVGGIPEVIGESGAAQLVRSHSPADWAAAIRRVLTNPAEAQQLVQRGRALVVERFSLDAMLDRYAELYSMTAKS
jgi:glycosyltransferase involved in cell wall biosynthesis